MYVTQVANRLKGFPSIPCVVIGFPLGVCTTASKALWAFPSFFRYHLSHHACSETRDAVSSGAKEIDMVIPVGLLKAKDYQAVFADILAVVQAAAPIPVKVILETVFLTDEEKIAASFISAEAGAAFVKTSTGFLGGGATVEDVSLMWKTVQYKNGAVKVKASGGVRTFEKCLDMFKAGAERIGTYVFLHCIRWPGRLC